ncbi:restriction endonuclease subunit S [Arthrobacter sp. SPG23]|uniref:restriction endonuclease subunit S n=1 Tax=Arthrobacter sp. SPG23 TaxID=1610703 RepID=UPI0006983E1F|nr:restriction endonuclease subunit S [Arthrobacter sp. SPG23]
MIQTLQEICSHVVDCKNRTAPEDPTGEYFAVGTPAMRGNVINYAEARRISEATFAEWTARLLPREGDILFAREAPVGPVVSIPAGGNVAAGQRTMLLRTDPEKADSDFLRFYLSAPITQARILALAHGSTTPHLRVADVRSFPVDLPPLDEQKAIAEILRPLDDRIAANAKLAQTSALLAQTLFAGSMRAADHDVALCEVTELLSRGVAPKYSDAEDSVVVLNQKCIRDQRVNLDPARRTLISKVREDKMLRMDDVLVNSTGQGTLGRVARWTNSGSVTVDSHITIVRFDEEKVDPVCAGMALLALQKTIEEMGEGSTGQTELSRTELGKLRMRLPERSLQSELGHRIKAMSEMESSRLSENQTLAATRDTLLPQLMSGKLRVKDAEKVLENAGV